MQSYIYGCNANSCEDTSLHATMKAQKHTENNGGGNGGYIA